MAACPVCGEESREGARFCDACGAPLTAPAAPASEVRKTVTVLFSDVTGSTALGERHDPESMRRVMARYFEEMRAVIERHGGTVEKFIGDAVMAVFGIPQLHEDDALRAVRAGVEMRERLAALNEELERDFGTTLQVRTGINTGEVVAGSGETLATGDAVNVAARLEQAAQAEEILIGEQTYRLVAAAVEADPVEPLTAKGKAEPVPAWRVLSVLEGAAPFARRLELPLVGRTAELAELRATFDRARAERSCRLATVLGPPGIGKSRLAVELAAILRDDANVFVGRCLSYGEGITYWPLREIVRSAAGDETAEAIRRLLPDGEESDDVAALVASAVGSDLRPASVNETFWAVRRLFEELARNRPLVLVLEDVHWAEATFLDLVEYVLGWTSDAPILVVALARPEFLGERSSWPSDGLSVTLEPLGEVEAEALIDNMLGDARLDADTRSRITEAAEGNPLFVEQMLAMLAEQAQPGVGLGIPPTIQALLAARLEQLPKDERGILERASVVGKEFWLGAVVDLSKGADAASVARCLMGLVRKGFIRPEASDLPREDAFGFRHILIREAAYARLSKDLRATLHERFAGWLDAKPGEWEELVGYHLEQAVEHRAALGPLSERDRELAESAAERLSRAGRRAFGRGDVRAALNLASRALDIVPSDSPRRSALMLDVADALYPLGQLRRAEATVVEARDLARAAGDRLSEWDAVIDLHVISESFGRSAGAMKDAEEALVFFEEVGEERGQARARIIVGGELAREGRYKAAEAMFKRAYEHALRGEDMRSRSMAGWTASSVSLVGPTPLMETLAWLESLDPNAVGHTLWPPVERAKIKAMLGEVSDARRLLAEVKTRIAELGVRRPLIFVGLASGQVEILDGDAIAAEREFRLAFDLARELDEPAMEPLLAVELARARYKQGDYAGAEALLERGNDLEPDEFAIAALPVATRAKLVARRGDHEQALELARDAVRMADETDALNFRGDVRVDLAEAATLAGLPTQAAAALEEARSLYEQKGNIASARTAQRLLAELAAEPLAERD